MNEYNIAVDFQRGNIYTDLSVLVQNDHNAYKINFDFDKEFDRALFKLKYPVDNKVWVQEITDNQLTLPVLNDTGDYEYEIAIYSEDGRLTDYATEKFHVRSELISTDEIVESDDRVPILDNLINTVNTLENNVIAAEESRVSAESTRVENENTRISNEITRTENETVRQTNETTRTNNESVRTTAENGRISAESERVSNETTRQTNEITRVSNETTRISNEETRTSNENTRELNETTRIANETAREEYIDDFKQDVEDGKFNGNGIVSFTKTSTTGLVDTYTVVFTNGTTTTLTVTNGKGITSIELTSTEDNIDTYTIYYNDGTTSTFTVTNSSITDQEFNDLEEEVIKYKTISNVLPKSEGKGTNIELNETGNAFLEVMPIGNTNQKSTTGKNLFDKNNIVLNKRLGDDGEASIDENGYCTTNYFIPVKPNTAYYSTARINQSKAFCFYDNSKNFISRTMYSGQNLITTVENVYYIKISILLSEIDTEQIEEGSTATEYEPYTEAMSTPNPTIKFEEKEDCNFDNTWKQGQIRLEDGEEREATNQVITTNFLKISPNVLYQLSRTVFSSYMMFRFYDINMNYLGYQQTTGMIATEEPEKRMKANVSSMIFAITNSEVAYMRIVDNSNDLSTIYTLKKLEATTPYSFPVKMTTGEQKITIKNKNLFKINNFSKSGWNVTIDNPLKNMNSGTYTISCLNKYASANIGFAVYFSNEAFGSRVGDYFTGYSFGKTLMNVTRGLTNEQLNANYMIIAVEDGLCTQEILENMKIQIEKENMQTSFANHEEQIFQLDLSKIGKREKKIKSKNFLENVIWQSGYISSNNEIVSASNWVHSGYINIENIQYYTAGQTGNNPKTILYDENFNVLEVLNLTINKTTDISVFNAKYIRISATETSLSNNQLFNEKTISFDIGLAKNDFFFKNKKDSKYYDNSLELNKWYAKSHWEEEILTGEENITNNNETDTAIGFSMRDYASIIDNSEPSNIFCNMLAHTTGGFPVNTLRIATSGNIVLSFKKGFCEYTSAAIKAKIKEYHDNDIPFIIYIPLATPNNILITDEDLIEQLESLNNNARSYERTTYINCESFDEDDEVIDVNAIALKDLNIVLDTINNAILEIGGGN